MPKPFPKNAPGAFYVEDGMCIACYAPESVAPDLMDHAGLDEPQPHHCYFKKQPGSSSEVDRAITAMQSCCCGALRYGGEDRHVIERLLAAGVESDCLDAHHQ